MNTKTCGGNLRGQICRGSTVAVLDTGFLGSKSCWGLLETRPLGTEVCLAVWLILVDPAFFLVPNHLYKPQICHFLGGIKLQPVLCQSPRSTGCSLHSPFLGWVLSFGPGSFLLALSSAGWGMMSRQNEAVLPYLFVQLFLGIIICCCSSMLLKFLKS